VLAAAAGVLSPVGLVVVLAAAAAAGLPSVIGPFAVLALSAAAAAAAVGESQEARDHGLVQID